MNLNDLVEKSTLPKVIKQKYRYMVVSIFIYAIFSYTSNLREGFWD